MRLRVIICFVLICTATSWAQKKALPSDDNNIVRAVEALNNGDGRVAFSYISKALNENPENGRAFYWLAYLDLGSNNQSGALTNVNKSLKYLSSKEKEYKSFAYELRSQIYLALEDTVRALRDLDEAIDIKPSVNAYIERANVYSYQLKYDLSYADYCKVVELDKNDILGHSGMGVTACRLKRYDEAIKHINRAIDLNPDIHINYVFRADAYCGQKQYDKALDDLTRNLPFGDAFDVSEKLFMCISDSAFVLTVDKLKDTAEKEGGSWWYFLAKVYSKAKKYTDAVTAYLKVFSIYPDEPICCSYIAQCYMDIRNHEKALSYLDKALSMDSTYYNCLLLKADVLYGQGKTKEAIDMMGQYIDRTAAPYGFYCRGFYKDDIRDVDGAIEDYSLAIAILPELVYSYLGRADMYKLKGYQAAAEADYKQVIKLDKVSNSSPCAHFAYLALGQKDKAIEYMDKVLALRPEEAGNYYDAACFYTRMGETEKSLDFLQTAFEKGYREFTHIENDDDMDAIRDTPRFKEMIQKYKEILRQEVEKSNSVSETD